MASELVKSLTDKDWKIIKKRYENGDRLTKIANDYNVGYTTIQRRARVQNWGDKYPPVELDLSDKINNKITDKLSEIKSQMKSIQVEPEPEITYTEPNVTPIDHTKPLAMTIHEEISQEIKQELKQEVKQNIKEEVRQDINAIFEMQQSIKILSRNCLDIHAKVLRRVRTKFMNDEMTELQVATVLSKMGFTLGTLRDIAEMGNSSKVNNNIQINNDNQQQHATIRLVR